MRLLSLDVYFSGEPEWQETKVEPTGTHPNEGVEIEVRFWQGFGHRQALVWAADVLMAKGGERWLTPGHNSWVIDLGRLRESFQSLCVHSQPVRHSSNPKEGSRTPCWTYNGKGASRPGMAPFYVVHGSRVYTWSIGRNPGS